jgi:hypothetical protein
VIFLTIGMVAALALCAYLVYLLTRQQRDHDAQKRLMAEDWALERRELLNRIQHPQLVPQTRVASPVPHEQPRDAAILAHIGQIVPGHLMEDDDLDG